MISTAKREQKKIFERKKKTTKIFKSKNFKNYIINCDDFL